MALLEEHSTGDDVVWPYIKEPADRLRGCRSMSTGGARTKATIESRWVQPAGWGIHQAHRTNRHTGRLLVEVTHFTELTPGRSAGALLNGGWSIGNREVYAQKGKRG